MYIFLLSTFIINFFGLNFYHKHSSVLTFAFRVDRVITKNSKCERWFTARFLGVHICTGLRLYYNIYRYTAIIPFTRTTRA